MKTVTIRGLPDELHARLKQRAHKHRRSLNQQIIAELAATSANTFQERAREIIAQTDALRADLGAFATAEEIDAARQYGRK